MNKREYDRIYDVDIHIVRHPGMDNSLQYINGDKLSVMTATTSYIQTLLDKKVMTEEEVRDIVEMAIKGHKGELK